MSGIRVHCELQYTVETPTSFAFAVVAAQSGHQLVTDERLVVHPDRAATRSALQPSGHDLVRVVAEPGPFSLVYDAAVTLSAYMPGAAPTAELPFADLPTDVLPYLTPSRYCQSDLLGRLAEKEFGDIRPGFERVTAVCDWVHEQLEYVPGSTDGSSTAVDVLVGGAGVCRDYAHLSIALCRALGIPVRYVSGYALDLDPPDFHGFFEGYLGDVWYLFDATRMASVDGLVRIASGRDAADVAFATSVGSATLDRLVVAASGPARRKPDTAGATAVSTA